MNKILHFLTVLFLCVCTICSSVEAKINIFEKARYIPALSVYDDAGHAYQLKDFHSDLLIALLWSKTCGPCLSDLRQLGAFVTQTKDDGIEVILISPDKEWKTVADKRAFLRRLNAVNMVSLTDKNNRFKDGMGVGVTPTAILVDRNGEEVGHITGSVKWSDPEVIKYMKNLRKKISKKLDEREAADKQN
ncbi:MAG: TlpA family protein disulfide reductase [Alphaproteobacteria bacterium]|nr:TlpA family protein disulfide reductase [Alphaproteobacteria bacterium]